MDKIFLGNTYRVNGVNVFEERHYIIYAESGDDARKKLSKYGDLAFLSRVSDRAEELNLSKIDEYKLLANNSNAYLIRGQSLSNKENVDIMVFAESAAEARRRADALNEIIIENVQLVPKISDIIL